MPIIVIVLAGVGLVGIVAGLYAVYAAGKFAARGAAPAKWRLLRLSALALGVVLGVATWPLTVWMGYPIETPSGVGRVVGLPFFVAFFDSAGRDYVGPLTTPAAIANVVFWFMVPQLALLFGGHHWRKRGSRASSS